MCRTTEKDPRKESPLSAWRGKATERNGQRGLLIAYKRLQKGLWQGITPAVEAVGVPDHVAPPGSPQAKQLQPLHTQPSVGQSRHRQEVLHLRAQDHFGCVQLIATIWTMACWASLSGFSKQEHWSVLANTGFHTLLEHYASCCPGRQLPWVPGAARTPGTQAAAPPPQLALTGADPSPPGQPQEQTPVDNPHVEVKIKSQLKPRDSVTKKEDSKSSQKLYNL